MLLKSFALDHVKEGRIFILESVMFQHSKIQGLWLSNSFRNGNSCSLSVQGKLQLWGPVHSNVLVAPCKLHFWAQWPSELWAIKRQGTKNPLFSFSSGCFTCSGRCGSSRHQLQRSEDVSILSPARPSPMRGRVCPTTPTPQAASHELDAGNCLFFLGEKVWSCNFLPVKWHTPAHLWQWAGL